MIRLGLKREPYWLDLPGLKLRLQVRPCNEAVIHHAQAIAAAALRNLREHYQAVKAAGGEIVGMPDLDNVDVQRGVIEAEFTKALGQAAIIGWEGVYKEDGVTPAPVTPLAIAELMEIYPIGTRFRERYFADADALLAEKNEFAPALDGTGAAGASTANSAEPTEAPAAAANAAPMGSAAPTSNTSR